VDGTDWVEESVTEFATSNDADCVVAHARFRSTLTIYLKEECDPAEYDQMCSFTSE